MVIYSTNDLEPRCLPTREKCQQENSKTSPLLCSHAEAVFSVSQKSFERRTDWQLLCILSSSRFHCRSSTRVLIKQCNQNLQQLKQKLQRRDTNGHKLQGRLYWQEHSPLASFTLRCNSQAGDVVFTKVKSETLRIAFWKVPIMREAGNEKKYI